MLSHNSIRDCQVFDMMKKYYTCIEMKMAVMGCL